MNYESEHETKDCFLKGTTATREECSSSQHKRKKVRSHMLEVQMLSFKLLQSLILTHSNPAFSLGQDIMKYK